MTVDHAASSLTGVLVVWNDVAAAAEDEYNAWYWAQHLETDHGRLPGGPTPVGATTWLAGVQAAASSARARAAVST